MSSPLPPPANQEQRSWWKVYLGVLLLSHLVWALGENHTRLPEQWRQTQVPALDARTSSADQTLPEIPRQTLAWRLKGAPEAGASTLVLLHGSPGRGSDFRALLQALPPDLGVLVVDLPGFGASRPLGPDLSARGAALQVNALLDSLELESCHLLGWSMGGAVATELAQLNPDRAQSLYLLASLGVIEYELLGSHTLNHGLHQMLLATCQAARWGLPHFGAWNGLEPLVAFGRNFAETDQRRLRGILSTLDLPVRILHGTEDPLIPVATAREHERIVPQAQLQVLEGMSHFLPFTWTQELATDLDTWIDQVEASTAPRRSGAKPERLTQAKLPFDSSQIPPLTGLALLLFGLLLALATLASEDLACIAAGFLVADGRMDWVTASLFCFGGIYVGDMLLFMAGRFLGRSALRIAPFRWMLTEDSLTRASRWIQERGSKVVLISRFLPGLRLPIYFAAGLLRTRIRDFALWFAIAGLVWTPILVGATALIARHFEVRLDQVTGDDLLRFALFALLAVLLLHQGLRLCTWHGRRTLLGTWRRWTRHEFWPAWLYYTPVILDVLWMAVRHRGLTLTAANPAMPMGGLIGESKAAILEGLGEGPEIPAWIRLEPSGTQTKLASEWMEAKGLQLPLVLKPDAGQRGSGVQVLHRLDEFQEALKQMQEPTILMEFAEGPEFGVFWVHPPSAEKGTVVGVTIKQIPHLEGDGQHSLSQLILSDPRAVALHSVYARENPGRMEEVPAEGERVPLVEVGTHARGAIFLDGQHLITPQLEAAVARIAERFVGFHLGRFDLKAPSSDHLSRGENLRVIELNGVTSEQTEMWDPQHNLVTTYRMQHAQWSRAFQVGQECARMGTPISSMGAVMKEVWRFHRGAQD